MNAYALVHAANLISLASYIVRDVLWLRALAVAASACTITYLAMQTPLNQSSMAWSALFSTINVIQIVRLLHERRPVHFTAEQSHLYDLVFRALSPRDFLKLWERSQWLDATAQQQLIRAGEIPVGVMVVCAGSLSVKTGDQIVARLEEGHFVGEMSFITGNAPKADVFAMSTAKLRLWPRDDLRAFLDRHPELRATVQVVFGTDLVRKLNASSTPR